MKKLNFFILLFVVYPGYVLFNNLILHINSVFLSNTPQYLFIGTVCTIDAPLSEINNENIYNVFFIVFSRTVILILPIMLLVFNRVKIFRLFFFFTVSFSFLDLFGILNYLIDNLVGANSLFRLYLSHSNSYLLSKYLNLPKITIPLICIFFVMLGYSFFREKLSKNNLKHDISYSILSSLSSLVLYYCLIDLYL